LSGREKDRVQEDLDMVVGYVGTQVYEKLLSAKKTEGAVARMGAPSGGK
jgi:hypothetical protein